MSLPQTVQRTVLLATLAVLLAAPALPQQTYVSRYNFFAGYAYLNSPAIKMPEHGFQFQAGINPRTWLALGFDYSNTRGDLKLTPNLVTPALQQTLTATLAQLAAAGQLPPNYQLVVPAHSYTQTFAMGPQFNFRHFKQVTLFVRPSLGAIREVATPKPGDPIAALIVKGLTPTGHKTDWQGFYGAGGGVDLNFSEHVGLRVQVDYVWDHLFNDILANGRRTVRLGIGPTFNVGKNIVK